MLCVHQNGRILTANKAAQSIWPVLEENNSPALWELIDVAQQTLVAFLSKYSNTPDSPAHHQPGLTFIDKELFYQLQVLGQDGEHYIVEAEKLQQPEITLPAATALSVDFLDAVLSGIDDQMMAVMDKDMRYLAFNNAYKKEYARIFAIVISPGDALLDTLHHLPDEQEKALKIWDMVLKGEEFTITETFGHASLNPTTYQFSFFPLKDHAGNFLGALYRVKDVSPEHGMEGLLRDSEERFKVLAEHTPDIVVRYGPDMQVLYVNSATEHETGVPAEFLVNKSIYETPNAGNISAGYLLKIKQVFEGGEEKDLISTYLHEGVVKNFYTRFIPEKNAAKEVVSVIAISRNISELQEAQKELQQARNFIFMADIIPQLIWITEANGEVSFFNQRWYDYTGLGKEESLNWGWQTVIHPDDLQNTIIEWEHSLKNGEPYQVEYRLRGHDGNYRWFMGRAMPLKDANDNVLKWYGFCADIHEHKQNRTELAEIAQEFQLLNQMIPQIVWSSKPNGDHDYFNQRWFEYTGLSYDQSKDQGWSKVLHSDDREKMHAAWNHSISTGEIYQIEYRFRRFDGVYRWFIGRATPLKNFNGQIVKWFGTCTDIHDQKVQSEVLAQKNYELQQINSYLDQFVHTTAHDLRSPVANMKLLYDMIMREEKPDKKEKLLGTFKPLLTRLDNTIIGLVEIVQMQEGHSALRVQDVDPLQVLQEVKEELSEMIKEANVRIEEQIVLEKPLYYLKPYLQSILRNLISNAIKYRDLNRPLSIKVKGEWKEKCYWISVEDNGMGIDLQRNNKNLFRPFKRLTQQGQGLGIGLHMVQNMVSKNGGRIEVSSTPGAGSTFSVFLNPYEH